MFYIGIDPGKSGALAVVGDLWCEAYSFSEENYIVVLNSIREKIALAVVERVGAMPKQGVVSTFQFGQNFGWTLGVLATLKIPYELILPKTWKKEFGCTSDKNTSIDVAKRLFPGVSLMRTERCTTPHDGKAEALLMAEYARRLRERA